MEKEKKEQRARRDGGEGRQEEGRKEEKEGEELEGRDEEGE